MSLLSKSRILFQTPLRVFTRRMGIMYNRDPYWKEIIGNREVVGYGMNGQPTYADRYTHPFPAIRWKENTSELLYLQEKQRCDWRLLTKQEKKTIYRANFCLTFAEMNASTGEWMEVVGYGLIFVCLGVWLWIIVQNTLPREFPHTFSPELIKAQHKRKLDIRHDPIWGFSSYYDFEKMDWKPGYWFMPKNPYAKDEEEEE